MTTLADVHAMVAAGARVSAQYADLRGADLRGADLRYADLRYADLRYARLQDANLRYANLRYANLQYADLSDANLQDVDLQYTNLQYATWQGLRVDGIRSGQVTLTPTPAGWDLRIGCWHGTIASLTTMIASDDGWPEAFGAECAARRPALLAVIALTEAHTAYHADTITDLAALWPAEETP